MNKTLEVILSRTGGVIIGILIGLGIRYVTMTPNIEKGKIFQRELKPPVMRVYGILSRDGIFVENPNEKGEYIPLKKYLETIPNKYDRKIEEAEIKKQVSW